MHLDCTLPEDLEITPKNIQKSKRRKIIGGGGKKSTDIPFNCYVVYLVFVLFLFSLIKTCIQPAISALDIDLYSAA